MSLQEMLTEVRRLDESVLVFKLKNGFAVGCEKGSNEETKFAALSGQSDLSLGHNARLVASGDHTSFSSGAKRTLDDFTKTMENPISQIESEMEEMYDRILEPIEIQPVHKRNFGYALPIVGITLTYPVSAPLTYLFYRAKGIRDIDGVDILFAVLATPFLFPGAVGELVSPSVKGVRITNKEVFSDKPEGDEYVGIFTYGKLNPDFFGDSSCVTGRKAYLQVVFPDGLQLLEGHAFYPENGNHYRSARHFLKTDKGLIDGFYSIREREEQVRKGWCDFRDNLKPEEVGAVLRTLETR